jgi:MFS family permease
LPTVLIHPFELEFGWGRAAISSAISINLLLFGVAGPLGGWFLDRFGPRCVMIISLAVLATALGATTLMREFLQFALLWGLVVGLAAGGVGSVLSATVVNRWFTARRGLALGILNSASSTGQLIFLPLSMALVASLGWRFGVLAVAAAALGLVPLVFLWMRDDPADLGLAAYGARQGSAGPAAPAAAASSAPEAPLTLLAMLSAPNFWFLAGSFFVCGGTSMGLIGTHLIPHTIDRGISQVTAAATIGIMGGLNFVGSILSGWVIDRVESRKWLSLVYALRGASLFILPGVTSAPGLLAFAVIYGLDWFATVAPTIALTADTFGTRSVARVYGWIFLFHQIGAALMASGAGFLRVWFGSYQFAFLIGGVLALIASGLALRIRPRSSNVAPVPAAAAMGRA